MNRMIQKKMNELVYVMFNPKLKGKRTIRELNKIENLSSYDEKITENN